MENSNEVLDNLDCGIRLKDFLNKYLIELHQVSPEKYMVMLKGLEDTTKSVNIESPEKLEEYLNKIHHEVVEEKGLWDVSDTSKIASSIGIDFSNVWYNQYSFNYVMNMVRADNYRCMSKFCSEYPSAKQYILDNPKFYAYLAKAWLEDDDAPETKLILYLKHIVDML